MNEPKRIYNADGLYHIDRSEGINIETYNDVEICVGTYKKKSLWQRIIEWFRGDEE